MMKSLGFLFMFILLAFSSIKVYAGGPGVDANDTTINLKSNIVIFKMIPSSAAGNSSNTNGGSLKKAGKVARTSNSPHTSIENILYKKKGI